ncbi:MAG TPA: ATP-binding protein [Verrucomicrobiae bacterium]|nr:ATP-binding protein [Verrucomicrobiae bacterium]
MAKKTANPALPVKLPGGDPHGQLLLQSTALAAIANGVLITDPRGTILWVNRGFTTLTGYAPAEVIGANPSILKSGQQDASFYRTFWQTILAGEIWQGEFVNRRKDGTIYINEETITPVRLHDGEITHFVGVMQDVTARKEAEAQVRALNDQLELRVKQRTAELQCANQELEAFAYSVSHDLRAPLRHIAGFLDLFSKSAWPSLSEQERHYLTQVVSSSKHMDRLIDDLLLFSRMAQSTMNVQRIDLGALIADALAQLEPEARGREIVWKRAELPIVQGDPAMLRQVLVNLLSNALKYTRLRHPAHIEIAARQEQSNEKVIFVRDNGVGFDMRYADKLFGVFQRLHSGDQFEGSGVGLANVRRIILRHGGRTWAEAKPDQGATFYFSLPAQPG